MAFIQLDFLSKYLNMHTAVNIALPMPQDVSAPMEDIPCIYLLHDAGEDMTSWQRNAAVERYANKYGVCIIMPDGALSFYEDMPHGGQYKSYIARELPALLRAYFPLSAKKEKNFIAGCGMGGRGALKLALENPDSYAAAGLFAASHTDEKPCCEAMESALMRAYGIGHDSHIHSTEAPTNLQVRHQCHLAQPVLIYSHSEEISSDKHPQGGAE